MCPAWDYLLDTDNGELGRGDNPRLSPNGRHRYSPEPHGTPETPGPPSPRSSEEPRTENRQNNIPALNFPQALQLVTELQGQTSAGRSTTQQNNMSDNGFDDDGGA